mmetsp:Transcript_28330/g.55065  ORF Transcript_28330/g.55065 Transcript_28330/m.55065 type:complete len:213 (+) Transcript_28330:409-1047(+)
MVSPVVTQPHTEDQEQRDSHRREQELNLVSFHFVVEDGGLCHELDGHPHEQQCGRQAALGVIQDETTLYTLPVRMLLSCHGLHVVEQQRDGERKQQGQAHRNVEIGVALEVSLAAVVLKGGHHGLAEDSDDESVRAVGHVVDVQRETLLPRQNREGDVVVRQFDHNDQDPQRVQHRLVVGEETCHHQHGQGRHQDVGTHPRVGPRAIVLPGG